MTSWQRTIDCGFPSVEQVGSDVTLNGWVHRQRDFGDLVFIDLRDRTGLVQVVVDKRDVPELVALANSIKSEWVLCVKGVVRARRQQPEPRRHVTAHRCPRSAAA